MMIHTFRLALLTALALQLSGCLKTRAELRGDDDGGATLQKQTAVQQRREKESVVREVKPPPPPAPKADEYDEQIRNLNGRLDTAESRVQQLLAEREAERNAKSQAELSDKQNADKKFQAYEEALTKMENEVKSLNEEIARLKAPPPAPAPAAGNGKGDKGDKSTPFDDAEAQFNAKKYKESIVLYQKYRDTYPKGKMFLEATYKIGYAFQELGMKDEARSFFEEVVAKAPKSKEAKKASFRMKTLK